LGIFFVIKAFEKLEKPFPSCKSLLPSVPGKKRTVIKVFGVVNFPMKNQIVGLINIV
jgi:hypothetical protein